MSDDYDVVCLTETWLDDGVYSSEFFSSNYVVLRSDRDFTRTFRSRGGGVLVAAKAHFKISVVDLKEFKDIVLIDIVGCKISMLSTNLLILVVYLPPDTNIKDFQCFFEALENFILGKVNVFIIGDFITHLTTIDAKWILNQ